MKRRPQGDGAFVPVRHGKSRGVGVFAGDGKLPNPGPARAIAA
jgi:hypothetical protein